MKIDRPRILLVETGQIVPEPTGSGNRAIRFGLASGLAHAGAVPAFYFAGAAGARAPQYRAAQASLALDDGRFWFDRPAEGEAAARAFAEALDAFRPHGILAYGLPALRLVRSAAPEVPVGVVSIDLEHLPLGHRRDYYLRYGRPKQRLKTLLGLLRTRRLARESEREVRAGYPQADVIINHARHHADWHAAQHGRPVLYTPNTLVPVTRQPPEHRPPSPPRFSLVGGLGGIATLTGLAWYATRVHPLLRPAIAAGELEVHLVGRGDLEPALDARLDGVVRRGYVEDLAAEFAQTTAVLVPTPIELGFRTRIADAFRHGVTTVSHSANTRGMPELVHDRNGLVAATPRAFAEAVLRLAREPALVKRLAGRAFADFQELLSSDVTVPRILDFLLSPARRPVR